MTGGNPNNNAPEGDKSTAPKGKETVKAENESLVPVGYAAPGARPFNAMGDIIHAPGNEHLLGTRQAEAASNRASGNDSGNPFANPRDRQGHNPLGPNIQLSSAGGIRKGGPIRKTIYTDIGATMKNGRLEMTVPEKYQKSLEYEKQGLTAQQRMPTTGDPFQIHVGTNATAHGYTYGRKMENPESPLKDRGDLYGCPKCSTTTHTYDQCCQSRAQRGEAPSLDEYFQLLVVNRRGLAQIRTNIDIFILALGFVDQNESFARKQAYPLSLSMSKALAHHKASQLHSDNAPNLAYGQDGKCTSIWEDIRTRNLQNIAKNVTFNIPENVTPHYAKTSLFEENFVSDDNLRRGLDMQNSTNELERAVIGNTRNDLHSGEADRKRIQWAVQRVSTKYIPEFTKIDFKWGTQLLLAFTLYEPEGAKYAEGFLKAAIREKHAIDAATGATA
ncbi:hypothetical protein CORC01_09236 [Colletotrichum orchidophilum]|uniref:Uncharacterized protein n=1 Tax=Colletotrichum orchidophilum TaxID=1209926 RepID=A0A1G4B2D1_9PEZI|nr:uncharacterized protein CORC01_09236 [Colletotrichum orchidophilum]OHE95503.1 hypothetical protein CORC01_09236 [Colletotrichum orchidophilum]